VQASSVAASASAAADDRFPHQRWLRGRSAAALLTGLIVLAGCDARPEAQASISSARLQRSAAGPHLEVQQRLDFSPRMLDALSNGIGLRIDYTVRACGGRTTEITPLWLRYFPLAGEFELRWPEAYGSRRFARRSGLLAALDQVRLPLSDAAAACGGEVGLALVASSLPAPLRFPALIGLQDWRLDAAPVAFVAMEQQ
jgi:hypothetical protein